VIPAKITSQLTTLASSKDPITKVDSSEDALSTESALLGPDNPINAGGSSQDKQRDALDIQEKAEL
jgi:hypothetical protein